MWAPHEFIPGALEQFFSLMDTGWRRKMRCAASPAIPGGTDPAHAAPRRHTRPALRRIRGIPQPVLGHEFIE
jgi:hypothetical protein